MNELALFTGAGGGILGGHLLGWRTTCAVEFDPYARRVLLARQRDGFLPRFPIWDDVRTFDGRPWRGSVDVVSGGFPCQDISCAGKGAGIEGERSGLWRHMARIVGEVRPRFVWVENSPLLVRRGLAMVLGDLAVLGYDARWGVVGAHHARAPHKRDRIWILAYSECVRQSTEGNPSIDGAAACDRQTDQPGSGSEMANANGAQRQRVQRTFGIEHANASGSSWWATEPNVGRVAHGVAPRLDVHGAHAGINVDRVATGVSSRMARLKCIGNGQVPAAMTLAFKAVTNP